MFHNCNSNYTCNFNNTTIQLIICSKSKSKKARNEMIPLDESCPSSLRTSQSMCLDEANCVQLLWLPWIRAAECNINEWNKQLTLTLNTNVRRAMLKPAKCTTLFRTPGQKRNSTVRVVKWLHAQINGINCLPLKTEIIYIWEGKY